MVNGGCFNISLLINLKLTSPFIKIRIRLKKKYQKYQTISSKFLQSFSRFCCSDVGVLGNPGEWQVRLWYTFTSWILSSRHEASSIRTDPCSGLLGFNHYTFCSQGVCSFLLRTQPKRQWEAASEGCQKTKCAVTNFWHYEKLSSVAFV